MSTFAFNKLIDFVIFQGKNFESERTQKHAADLIFITLSLLHTVGLKTYYCKGPISLQFSSFTKQMKVLYLKSIFHSEIYLIWRRKKKIVRIQSMNESETKQTFSHLHMYFT